MKTLLLVKLALAPLVVFWIAAPWLIADPALAGATVAASQLVLGAAMATSVALGRPWTAWFSARQWPGMSRHPEFLHVNAILSALWAAMFVYLALARVLALPAAASWMPVALAAAASVWLPRILVRASLARRLEAAAGPRWSPADFARSGSSTDAVVVGAGLGGLTAGALLADAGLKVTVFEQHVVAGGFAHHWLRKGRDGDARPVFRFDGGVHDVSGWWDGGPVHGLFERLGLLERIDWRRLDHRFVTDGEVFDVARGWDAYVAQLAARFPADAAGIRSALADLRAIHAAMYSSASQRCGVPGAPRSVEAMLEFARSHPLAVQWMDRSFDAFLEAHITGAQARRALGGLAGYVTDSRGSVTVAAMAPLFGYFLHGGYYPAGGSGQIANALVEAIERRGGRVRLKSPVAKVLVERGAARGVALATGETIFGSAVVMNADFLAATTKLVDPALWPDEFRARIAGTRPACSALAVHLGVRGTFPGLRPIVHVSGARGGVEIVIPSQVDPSAAPRGYSTVEIIRLEPQDAAQRWFDRPLLEDDRAERRSSRYLARKRAVADELIRAAEQALPDLSQRIVYRTVATPLTFRRYDWSTAGAIYGCRGAPTPFPSKSPIPGLVFAGAITHGPGVEAVMISGANAAEALVPDLLERPATLAPGQLGPAARPAYAIPPSTAIVSPTT
jgi:all-trans-retinol 13,14-reductase